MFLGKIFFCRYKIWVKCFRHDKIGTVWVPQCILLCRFLAWAPTQTTPCQSQGKWRPVGQNIIKVKNGIHHLDNICYTIWANAGNSSASFLLSNLLIITFLANSEWVYNDWNELPMPIYRLKIKFNFLSFNFLIWL